VRRPRSHLVAISALALALSTSSAALAQGAPEGEEAPVAPTAPVAPATEAPRPPAVTSDAEAARLALSERMDAVLAKPGGLTADDVARRSAGTSFEVMARRAELAAASADADRALSAYVPKVTLTARYTRLSEVEGGGAGSIVAAPGIAEGPIPPGTQLVSVPLSFPTLQNQYLLQASLTVPVSDYFLRVAPQNAAASRAEAAATHSVESAERRAATDARTAYYGWVRARLGVIVAEQALEQAKGHLADAQQALNVGTASPADVLRLESQVARSELLLESAQNLDRLTERQLRIAMHDRGTAPYAIGEDIRVDLPTPTTADADELAARALERRPEANELRVAADALRKQASVARAGLFPRFDLFANATYANPNSRTFPQADEFTGSWDAGAQLTWTISDIPSSYSAGRAESARAAALDARRNALADGIRLEIFSAIQDVREADLAIRTTARGLASAEESYRVRRLLFENGKATSTELLDAEADVTRARLEALGARIDARVARVRLAYATGEDV
jgi:outer membrane protein TolC